MKERNTGENKGYENRIPFWGKERDITHAPNTHYTPLSFLSLS